MYVFVDMEWISNQRGNHWPTQLAAARVDAHWNTVDTLSTLFRPKDFSFQQWGHMAFSGWNKEQFLNGESLYAGLDAFRHWLQPEDTICWWHQEASDLFNMFSKVSGVPDMTQHVVLLCDYIYGYLSGEEEVECMAYSELVKSFERIRNYMREFYVYGFKSRDEYGMKSARSYDNERRRIESWLGDYMSFHQESSGKKVFLSMDSRRVPCNPLYKAFKAKSFTDKDITLHFYIMDLLADGSALSSKEIVDRINDDYLSHFNGDFSLDESTVRKKLKEYEDIGLLQSEKIGREVIYRRTDNAEIDLDSWADALAYYSEADPLGVVGSFLLDKLKHTKDIFRFKHHYILHALDSDILCDLLLAINERRAVELSICSLRNGRDYQRTVCPLKIYSSTQSGRQYLLGYHYRGRHLIFFRLDAIKKVTAGSVEKQYEKYLGFQQKFDEHLWGVSTGPDYNLDHIEMTIHFGPGEEFILHRLDREKRHGRIEILDEQTCRFIADVYDASEMLPWIRTFIGRIVDLQCSNKFVVKTFNDDLRHMEAIYGGETDAI